MSWLTLFLGLILALAGGAALAASFDLLTTELGLLYATCGAIALSGGVIVIAIGLLIRRVDALRGAVLRGIEETRPERAEPLVPPLLAGIEPVVLAEMGAVPAREAPASEFSEPAMTPAPSSALDDAGDREAGAINENRKGHLPSLEALEQAAQEPPAPPTLVGRYSAGGANYSIFSDGSIEAETDQGAFKFGSMNEFKAFIAAKRI
ncbi:MAG: hypothetical protein ABSE69_11205 [Roseiarcus sp.]|jgi:hypothetical protein